MTDSHLTTDLLASWAERRLHGADRAAVEGHLADCAACRREASAIALHFRSDGRRRRLRQVAAPMAAIAAVLAIVLVARPAEPGAPAALAFRPSGDPDAQALRVLPVVAPVDGGVLDASPAIHFTWHADGPDAMYRFTLADDAGEQLWKATVADTVLTLPDSVSLVPGGRYLWYVDVLLMDGQKATTGVRGFEIAR